MAYDLRLFVGLDEWTFLRWGDGKCITAFLCLSQSIASPCRYDHMICHFLPPTQQKKPVCAVGLQIAVEKIMLALAEYQRKSMGTFVKEQRSFGFWSPRRCDVYIVSYHPGYLQDRLETAAYLWQHNISADVMHESGVLEAKQKHGTPAALCAKNGIL